MAFLPEDDYEGATNVRIVDTDDEITTITDVSGKKCLDVNIAKTVANGGVTNFKPKFAHSKTDITISTSDTTIFSFTGEGQLQAAMFHFDDSNVELILNVDSSEELRIGLNDLNDSNQYALDGNTLASDFPIWTDRSGKQAFIQFGGQPANFSTDFSFEAKGTSGSLDLQAYFILYREAL